MFGFSPEKALAKAEKYVQQGKLSQAIELYEKLLAEQPANFQLRNNLGNLYAQAGRNQDAAKIFREVAEAFESQGQTQRAIAILKKISKIETDSPDIQQRLAQLLISQGGHSEARGLLLDAAQKAEAAGDFNRAATALAQILLFDPEQARVRLRLALLRLKNGDQKRAQGELLAAAQVLQQANDPDGAQQALDQLEKIDSHWGPYRLLLASNALALGDARKALAVLPKPEELDGPLPGGPKAWRIAYECQDLDRAMELARAAIRAGDGHTAGELGQLLLNSGQFNEAADWVTGDPELLRSPDLRHYWVELLRTITDTEPYHIQALEAWVALSDGSPSESRDARLLLAHAYAHQGQLKHALEHYRVVAQSDPHDEELWGYVHRLEDQLGLARSTPQQTAPSPIQMIEQTAEPELDTGRYDTFTDSPAAAASTETVSASASVSGSSASVEASSPLGASAPLDSALELSTQSVTAQQPAATAKQAGPRSDVDLSDDWSRTANSDLETRIHEIKLYIKHNFPDEAEAALSSALAAYPNEPQLHALSAELKSGTAAGAKDTADAVAEDFEDMLDGAVEPASAQVASTTEKSFDFEISTDVIDAIADQPPAVVTPAAAHSVPQPEIAASAAARPAAAASPDHAAPESKPAAFAAAAAAGSSALSGSDLLASLVSSLPHDFAIAEQEGGASSATNESSAAFTAPAPPSNGQRATPTNPNRPLADRVLGDVFSAFRAKVEPTREQSNPHSHYSMGIAYKEMGLFEEAIGELQKAFEGWKRSGQSGQLLSCGTTLAMCFQQAGMPELAVQWYQNTLDTLRPSPEDAIGIQFELAKALESLGRTAEALDLYRKVYAANIDYQDVADCLRRLQPTN